MALMADRQNARMSKITDDGLTAEMAATRKEDKNARYFFELVKVEILIILGVFIYLF